MMLITKEKRPNDKMFTGIVRMINTGRTTAFRTPKTSATRKAIQKGVTLIPGKKYASRRTATVLISHLRIIYKYLVCTTK